MTPSPSSPAGFWKRYVAYFIDTIVVSMVLQVLAALPMMFVFAALAPRLHALERDASNLDPMQLGSELGVLLGWTLLITTLLYALVGWLYFAKMESSSWQASLGKRLLGIVVTDSNGQPLDFGRASARFFAAALSWLTLNIGHALAAWRSDKRALHDLLAGTTVLNADPARPDMPVWGWVIVAIHALIFVAGTVVLLAGVVIIASNAGELGLLPR